LIYGAQYSIAPIYLSLSALTGLTAVLGSYVIGSYLKSVGKTVEAMKISLVNQAIYVPLALLLIPEYRVVGLIIANLIAGFSSTLYGLHIVHRDFGLVVLSRRNVMILGALSLPAVAAWLTSFIPFLSIMVRFLLEAAVYLVLLALVLPLILEEPEIIELIELSKSVKLLSFIAPKILSTTLTALSFLNHVKSKFLTNKHD